MVYKPLYRLSQRHSYKMSAEPEATQRVPRVVFWAKILTLSVALTYLFLVFIGAWAYSDPKGLMMAISSDPSTWPPYFERDISGIGIFYVVAGAIFTPFHVWLAFAPRKPWVYVCHCVNIGLAILSCIYIPCAIPVGVLFLDRRVREYFHFR